MQHAATESLASFASPFARIALANIVRSYPNQPGHVLLDASSLAEPEELHPVFYGSYDWHSAVHMHWLLVTLLHRHPALPEAEQIRRLLSRRFTPEKIEKEALYFQQPCNSAFERTYGWAWLLKLQCALSEGATKLSEVGVWRTCMQPFADLIVQRYLDFLPVARFAIRAGTHGNSAFGLLFALEYAQAAGHTKLADRVLAKALEWFGRDRRYPADYEPGGDDFLSGGLTEAALMRQMLSPGEFVRWWQDFCPDHVALKSWLTPVPVADRSDPKLAHLDGLNLSRAWCWKMLRPALPDSLALTADSAIDAHLATSLPFTIHGHYAGTHWLASFALLALLA